MADAGGAAVVATDGLWDGGDAFTEYGYGFELDGGGPDIPPGVIPVRQLSTGGILYGERVTSYEWEVLRHEDGTDHLVGYLDGVVEGSASLSWTLNAAVKGGGGLKVNDLPVAGEGMIRLADVPLASARIRPVQKIEGLPDNPLGVYLFGAAPEDWSGTGLVVGLDLLDKATVLDQDHVDQSYTVDTSTPILVAVAAVVASAGESITVDAAVTTTLSSPMVWPADTSKLAIVNDLLAALGYSSLWVDGVGNYRATPYVVPAKRSLEYELLTGLQRELVDGDESIYLDEWSRDRDMFGVPNKVIAVQSGAGETPALSDFYANENPDSPFSYQARGNRWITRTIEVECPDGTETEVKAFLRAAAQRSLIASSARQAKVKVKHLPVPLRVSEAMRFASVPAGIDARHVVTSIELEAYALGLMSTELQEVIDL